MKVKYSHPAVVPEGIELETEYELTLDEDNDKAVVTRAEFKKEFTKYQGETLFKEIEEVPKK